MNNYFDLGSKKFLIITLVILACFFLLVVKAFNDLSDAEANKENQPQTQQAVDVNSVTNSMSEQKNSEEQNQEQQSAEQQTEQQQNKGLNVDIQSSVNATEELKPIDEYETLSEQSPASSKENSQSLSHEQQLEQQFLDARQLRENKEYAKAVSAYKFIADTNSDPKVKARCYEGVAEVYGITKRYGSAMSYAQKAFDLAPTSARELLIARLYYKTGDIDKATKRINNILKRDFAYDQ